jgi:hypothetical protein
MKSGDLLMAEKKEKQASQIYSELKRVHQQYLVGSNDVTTSTTTTLLWLKSKMEDDAASVGKIQQVFEKIVSSFLVSDSLSECQNYLSENKSAGAVFLIFGTDRVVADFQQLPNIKGVYRYEADKINYDELCSRLTCDLIAYYNKLGDDYSAKKDTKTARDMFMKAHELCNILNDF